MPGFPARIVRTSLGPQLVNAAPVVDPTRAIGAESFSLAWWQLTGMNLVCSIGYVILTRQGSDYVTTSQAFAFDPNAAMPLLVWTRVGPGEYEYTIPNATYPDEAGNEVGLTIYGGDVKAQGLQGSNFPLTTYVRTGPRSGKALHGVISAGAVVLTDIDDGDSLLVVLW